MAGQGAPPLKVERRNGNLRIEALWRAWVKVTVNEAPWYTRYIRGPDQRRTPLHCRVFSKTSCSTQLGPTCAGGHFLLPPFRQSGLALPVPVMNGEQEPGPTFTLGSLPQAEPCSQPSLLSTMFLAFLQRCASKTHPHLSTWASVPLVQGLCPSRGPPPSPGGLCSPKFIGNHCQCNLFQGCSVSCTPCSDGLNDPH